MNLRVGDVVAHKSLQIYGYERGTVHALGEPRNENPHYVCVNWQHRECGASVWHSPHELKVISRPGNVSEIPESAVADEQWVCGRVLAYGDVQLYGVFASMDQAMRPEGRNPICKGDNSQFVGKIIVGQTVKFKNGVLEGVEDVLWYVRPGVWQQWFKLPAGEEALENA
jgi:hypothetical protein